MASAISRGSALASPLVVFSMARKSFFQRSFSRARVSSQNSFPRVFGGTNEPKPMIPTPLLSDTVALPKLPKRRDPLTAAETNVGVDARVDDHRAIGALAQRRFQLRPRPHHVKPVAPMLRANIAKSISCVEKSGVAP